MYLRDFYNKWRDSENYALGSVIESQMFYDLEHLLIRTMGASRYRNVHDDIMDVAREIEYQAYIQGFADSLNFTKKSSVKV